MILQQHLNTKTMQFECTDFQTISSNMWTKCHEGALIKHTKKHSVKDWTYYRKRQYLENEGNDLGFFTTLFTRESMSNRSDTWSDGD